jgi:hypothetical protein
LQASDKDEWMDGTTTGSGSDGEEVIKRVNLVDKVPATPNTRLAGDKATTDMSTITCITNTSKIFPKDEGKYLFTFTIHFIPNRKHKEVLIEKMNVLFD